MKIVWPAYLDDPKCAIINLSVDAIDNKTWEKKHPTLNVDKRMCSQKFKSAGVKYEIGLCVRLSQCVWISGPFRCGKQDVTIFKGIEDEHDERFRESLDLPPYEECLQDKIAEGKLCIFDAGYRGRKRLAYSAPSSMKSHYPTTL